MSINSIILEFSGRNILSKIKESHDTITHHFSGNSLFSVIRVGRGTSWSLLFFVLLSLVCMCAWRLRRVRTCAMSKRGAGVDSLPPAGRHGNRTIDFSRENTTHSMEKGEKRSSFSSLHGENTVVAFSLWTILAVLFQGSGIENRVIVSCESRAYCFYSRSSLYNSYSQRGEKTRKGEIYIRAWIKYKMRSYR